jgi:arsenate reductase-like glutaredoxin family protein
MNTRSPAYKSRGLGVAKLSKAQALALMAEEPNLIKRPLVLGKKVVFGYKPDEYGKLG